jgi:hypothetical protein
VLLPVLLVKIRPELVKQVALKLAEVVLQAQPGAAAGRLQGPEAKAPPLQSTPVQLRALLGQQLPSQHEAAAATQQQQQQQFPLRAEPCHSQPHTAGLWQEVPDEQQEQQEQQQAMAQLEAAQAAFAALEVASLSTSSSAASLASTEEELQQHAGHGASSTAVGTTAGDRGNSSAEPGAIGVEVRARSLVEGLQLSLSSTPHQQ